MASRRVYQADREVLDACRARGVEVTARQLERWRSFLPERAVEHVRGMRGSRTTSALGYVDQVLTIAEATRTGIPLRRIPLVLFARGLPVKVEVLRTAYLDLLTYVMREIDRIAGDGSPGSHDPEDKADVLAIRMAARTGQATTFRRWETRAREAVRSGQAADADSARSLLASVLSAALTGLVTGSPATAEGISEALSVLGLNDGQDPRHVAEHLTSINFTALGEAIQSASLEEWMAARADLSALRGVADTRSRVEARVLPKAQQLVGLADLATDDPVSYAALVAGLLVVANDEWRQNLRSELARWKAVDQLLSALPERLHKYMPIQQVPAEVRQELAPILTAWAEQHPAEAKLLNTNSADNAPVVAGL